MKEKLIIENFGPIKHVDLDLNKINVFIGPNASGKSTISKIIAIAKDAQFFFKLLTDINFGNEIFENYNINEYYTDKSKILYKTNHYSLEFSGKFFKIEINENEKKIALLSDIKDKYNIDSDITDVNLILKVIFNDIEHDDFEKRYYSFDLISRLVNIPNKLLYVPTERVFISTISKSLFGLVNSNISLHKIIVSFGAFYEKAKNIIVSDDIDFLDISYYQKNGREYIKMNNNEIPLSASASGIQSVLPLILTIKAVGKDDTSFVIEEPELNLFPVSQKGLVSFLIGNAYKNNNSLTINTHSPYILMALNNLIEAENVLKELKEKGYDEKDLKIYEQKIKNIVKSNQLLDFDDIAVYYIHSDGTAEDIKDYENRLINAEKIDSVSDIFADETDKLLDISFNNKG